MSTLQSIPLWKFSTESARQAELRGDVESAKRHFGHATELAKKAFGCQSHEWAESLMNLADFAARQREYLVAETAYTQAFVVYEHLLGGQNRVGSMIYMLLATIHREQNNLATADLFERRAALRQQSAKYA